MRDEVILAQVRTPWKNEVKRLDFMDNIRTNLAVHFTLAKRVPSISARCEIEKNDGNGTIGLGRG